MSSRYRSPSVRPQWYRSRQRVITRAQKRAERALWPLYGLTFAYDKPIDLEAAFGRSAPTVLEIGCGSCEALTELAAARPAYNFVGVDWFRAGLAAGMQATEERQLTNLRLIRADAGTLLERGLAASTVLDEVFVLFPDPWYSSPERRVLRPETANLLAERMRPTGLLRVATDVHDYPDAIRAALAAADAGRPAGSLPTWTPVDVGAIEAGQPGHFRPSTKYARDAVTAGRPIVDQCFLFNGLANLAGSPGSGTATVGSDTSEPGVHGD